MFAVTVLTLFPGPLGQSPVGEALARGLWSPEARDIREHGIGRHRAVDDSRRGRIPVIAHSIDTPHLNRGRGETGQPSRKGPWSSAPLTRS
jgi:hypothetical protein